LGTTLEQLRKCGSCGIALAGKSRDDYSKISGLQNPGGEFSILSIAPFMTVATQR
jgi:hypothetical protein